MTPPVQPQALDVGVSGEISFSAERRWRLTIPLRDLVALSDMWLLLAVVWTARMISGYVDPSVALVGVASFVFLASPSADRRLDPRVLDDVGPVTRAVVSAFAVSAAVSALWGVGESSAALFAAAAAGPALLAGRVGAYALGRRARRAGIHNRVLVVGAGDIAQRVVSTLHEHEDFGLRVVGVVDDDPKYAPNELGAAILGGTNDIPRLVREREVDHVIVAFSSGDQRNMISVVRDALATGAGVWLIPRLFELGSAGNNGDHLWGLPLSRLRTPARSRRSWVVKRTLDVVIAGAALVILSPALAALAVATLIDSGRPIFLRQRRVGLDGKSFDLLKFRTMAVCEESVLDKEW
ncbi:MAG: sugar transferase, partial [Actinomycetota bacterium]|nr:sugar transferase [Actinomycetota bacterium]